MGSWYQLSKRYENNTKVSAPIPLSVHPKYIYTYTQIYFTVNVFSTDFWIELIMNLLLLNLVVVLDQIHKKKKKKAKYNKTGKHFVVQYFKQPYSR